MKTFLFYLLTFLIISISAQSQISLTATSGTTTGSYTTLKGAFDAINLGTHKGSITIMVDASTTETAAAVINASGSGAALYTSITIYPTAPSLSITGTLAGGSTIDFNGANNVMIDGRVNAVGNTASLSIINTSNSATAGTSTLHFYNVASYNTVRYCNIKGAEMNTAAGVIFFYNDAASSLRNNIIEKNNITNSGTRPVNGIYFDGSSATMARYNFISNNNLYDLICLTASSYYIQVFTYASDLSITGNSFYETSTIIHSNTWTENVIKISTTIGWNFTISGNYIGGSAPLCGGTPWTKSSGTSNDFIAINLQSSTTTASNIQGNTITNFDYSNSGGNNFTGISINASNTNDVNIGTTAGNIIGASSGNAAIKFTNGATGGTFTGIQLAGTGTQNVQNNTIGAITVANSNVAGTAATSFYGINSISGNSAALTVNNNLIGSTSTSNSINATSTSSTSNQIVYGISHLGTGITTISGNTIAKLSNACTAGAALGVCGGIYDVPGSASKNTIINNTVYDISNASNNSSVSQSSAVLGIALNDAFAGVTISGNTIYNLYSTNAAFTGTINGIYYAGVSPGAGSNNIFRNYVGNISVDNASTGGNIYGINCSVGNINLANNLVAINANNNATTYGIYEATASYQFASIYFNTVSLGGTITSGTNKSYALYSKNASSVKDIRNNIFVNNRSTIAGSSLHYAAFFNYATSNLLTLKNNDYYVSGTGSVLGNFNSADVNTVPLIAGLDAGSVVADPVFTNASGNANTVTDYMPTVFQTGAIETGILTDYAGNLRSLSAPKMGIYETASAASGNTVSVYKSASLLASYTDLKAAFDKINSGVLTGNLTIKLTASEVLTSSAVLNASGTGLASYSSINIYPTVSGITIVGNLDGIPLIDLNGAKYVTIDGRVNATGSNKDLQIINGSNSNLANTSTIRFINDAAYNLIKYCTIKGSTTNTSSGVMFFSTTTGTIGNSYNKIDNNNFTSASDGFRPYTTFYSLGTSTKMNSRDTITNNNIYNFANRTSNSYAMDLENYSDNWNISSNSFYETAPFVTAGNFSTYCININTSGTNSGSGFIIKDNFFGGSSPRSGSGGAVAKWTKATDGYGLAFTAIYLYTNSAYYSNTIEGNTISNFDFTNTSAANFTGINIAYGFADVGSNSANIIGSSTGSNSISILNGTNNGTFYGITTASPNTVTIKNNSIGGITLGNVAGTPTFASHFYGINKTSSGTTFIQNNLIGSIDPATTNSINDASLATANAQNVYGIYLSGTGITNVANNIVSKLTNGTTNTTLTTFGLINGIYNNAGTVSIVNNIIRDLTIANANQYTLTGSASVSGINSGSGITAITGNSIFNLSNTYSGFTGSVNGLIINNVTSTGSISNNFIYNLSLSANATGNIYGIDSKNGKITYSNNIISLTGNGSANVYGIIDENNLAANVSNLYYNTIYINGVATGSATSYALYGVSLTGTRDYRNNLLINERTTVGGTNLHYAAYFNYAASTLLTLDYNNYQATGTGGVLGYYAAANVSTLPLISGMDANSNSGSASLANPGGTSIADYYAAATLAAVTGTGILSDLNGNIRSGTTPKMGALENASAAQAVDVYIGGSLRASYSNLKTAFDKINDGTHTGAIELRLNTSENLTSSATIYASGVGASNYSSVTIFPTVSGLTITGNIAGPLIDFNGASHVIIDGRVNATGATKDLALINTSIASVGGVSTIRYINDANYNAVKYCIVKGSTLEANSGIIYFGIGLVNGNNNNLIDNNDITCASDANRPLAAISSLGLSDYTLNKFDTLSNNNIYNFFNRATAGNVYGINMNSYTSSFSVIGNSLYETATYTPGVGNLLYVININNATSGVNFNISNNYIGGSAPICGGSAWTKTNAFANSFYAITVNTLTPTSTPTSIQGNTIKNLSLSNGTGTVYFIGVGLTAGDVNIGTVTGNTIGQSTGNASILFSSDATGSIFYGIQNNSAGNVNIKNNTIASITVANSNTTYATSFVGYYKNGSAGTVNFSNNTVGSTDPSTTNSITASSTSTASTQTVEGVKSAGTGTQIFTGNIISKMTNSSTNTSAGYVDGMIFTSGINTVTNNTIRDLKGSTISNLIYPASVQGLTFYISNTTQIVSGNTIYNLSNANTAAATTNYVTGLYYYTNSTINSTLSGNYIGNITVDAATTLTNIYGIRNDAGPATYINNIINLSGNTKTNIYGIYDPASGATNLKIYNNTVYIGGTVASGTNNSYCIYSAAGGTIKDIRNNIFYNARSTTGGTNLHYVLFFNSGLNLTLNYNDYYSTGTGSALANYNLTNYANNNFAGFKTATSQDVNSLNVNPLLASAGGSLPENYFPSATVPAISLIDVPTDYFGSIKSASSPKMGALENAALVQNNTVSVYNGATLLASYTDLKGAFDKINDGTHTGAIDVQITASQTLAASAILNASGNGSANYTGIHIYPISTGLIISGNLNGPLISLEGAGKINLDGRVNATGSSKDLVVVNSAQTNFAGGSVLQFINGATYDTIQYCVFKGASVATSTGANIYLGGSSSIGNSNNLISNNDFTSVTDNSRPVFVIGSQGSATANNNDNIISNNNFYNHFCKTIGGATAIYISSNSNRFSIINNSIYETTQYLPAIPSTLQGIFISSGTGYIVSNNYIGGSAPQAGGTAFTKIAGTNTNSGFVGIVMYAGSGTPSAINGNVISNFNFTNTNIANNFIGINAATGDINVGTSAANIIGSATGNGAISFSVSTVASAYVAGISLGGSGILNIQNNIIGSITTSSSGNYPVNIYGINVGSASGTINISNNSIGSSSTTNSIYASSTATAAVQFVAGIYTNSGSGVANISGNTISNLTNGSTNANTATLGYASGIYLLGGINTVTNNTISYISNANANNSSLNNASVTGIAFLYATANAQNISGNKISNLSNSYTPFTGSVIGLYYSGSNTYGAITKNYISNLNADALSPSVSLIGIKHGGGNATYSNNIINLTSSPSLNTYGFYEPGAYSANANIYFNTVNISGVSTSSSNYSYALYSAAMNNIRDFRNNILVNTRSSNTGSNLHFAEYLNYYGTTNLTNDYNNYYTTGTATALGFTNGAAVNSIGNWKTATGTDANSQAIDPVFANSNGTTALDFFSTGNLAAQAGTSITKDYSGLTRNASTPHMGAFEASLPATPTITSFTPTGVAMFGTVTITGTNLADATDVSFGGTAASSFTAVNSTTITAVVGTGTSGTVSVTTPGGTATKTGFSIVSNDLGLSALTISSGTLNPTFSSQTLSYTVTVTGSTSSVTVQPTVTDNSATIKVNGTTVASAANSDTIALSIGDNTINVVVTAQDGVTTKTYSIVVTRPANTATLTTGAITDIANTTATVAANISADGGASVTARGVCWSSSTGPTIAGSKTTDGSGIGSYTSSITGLTANTTYYVRAYATNSVGTSYGAETSFKTNQQFTLADINKVYGDAVFTISNPASNSVGAFSYSSSDNTVASVSGNTVTILKAGTSTITVTQAADGAYTSQSATATLTVAKADQIITLIIPASAPLSTFIISATGVSASSNSGLTVSISKDAGSTATADLINTNGNYTITNVSSTGTITINATQAGNANYNAATVSKSFDVTKGNATLNFGSLTPVTYTTGLTVDLSNAASTNATGATIDYTVVSGPATISGNTLTVTSAGTVKVKASQNANANWNAATDVYQDLIVNQASPTITGFSPVSGTALTTVTITGTDFDNATAVSFGGVAANSFTVTNSTTISAVVGSGASGAVSITTPGGTVSKSGFTWNSKDAKLSGLTISAGVLSPGFDAAITSYTTSVINSVATITLTPTVNESHATITVNGTAISSGTASQALALSVGDNVITIVVTAQDLTTTTTYTVTVTRPATTATLTTTAISAIGITAASSGGNISGDGGATVTARGVCWSTSTNPTTADSKTIDGSGTGTYSSSVTGLAANTKYYLKAYAVNSMGTSYGSEISFTTNQFGLADINKTYGDPAFTIANPTTNSLGAISFASSNTSVATVTGNTVTIVGAGTTTITVSQAASGDYSSQSTTATLTVAKAAQVITLSIPTTAALNTFTATSTPVTASSSAGLVVTVVKDAASTATATLNYVSDGNYTLTGVASVGTIIINATQAGDANHNAASVSQSFDVTKGNQIISFAALSSVIYSAGMTQDLTASSGSGLTISYTVVSGPATVSGNTLTITGTGTVKIKASQAGDVNWNAATDVYQDLVVNQAAPSITSLTPSSAGALSTITITGTHFENTTAVSFGGTDANSFTVIDPTSITAVVGIGATGDVAVTTLGGTITKSGFSWLSSDATLSAMSISAGTLSPSYASATTSYTVSVANSVSGVTITPTVNEAHATVTVNGTSVISGSASQNTALVVGDNTISVIVTAQDATTKTYTITVTRAATTATISTTVISAVNATSGASGGNITDDGGTTVTARGVCWNTSTNPTIANSKTTDGSGTGSFSSSITGLTANTTYYVKAYATNSIGTSYGTEYSFTTNKQLSLADISKVYGDAAFDITNPASNSNGTFSYSSSNTAVATVVGNTITIAGVGTSTITVTQSADGTSATQSATAVLTVAKGSQSITFGALTAVSYTTGLTVDLSGAATTNANGASISYSVVSGPGSISGNILTVTNSGTIRIKASQIGTANWNAAVDAYQNLVVNQAAPVISSFSPTSAASGSTITITGTNFDNATAVSFGGVAATSYNVVSSTSITAVVGSGAAGSVSVTTAGGTTTKTGFSLLSSDATLSALTISSGTLSPTFISSTVTYTSSVAFSTTGITVTPTVSEPNATIKVNGTVVTSASASQNITLNVGDNTITIEVTAQDGTTVKTYTITVTRAADIAPSNLSYTTPVVYTENVLITTLKPTIIGAVVNYSVSPALPTGLTLNTTTGFISGTPTVITGASNYTVTASNSGGNTTAIINITINAAGATGVAPSNLSYSTPVVFTQNIAINNLKPSVSGTVNTYSITPGLPSGLAINATTGIISGTPSLSSSGTDYLITATNTNGSTGFTINLTVNATGATGVAPSNLTYSTPNVFVKNTAITALNPTVTGTVVSYSVSPALPVGLSMDVNTGIISGTPSASSVSTDYQITATNSYGSTAVSLNISVSEIITHNTSTWTGTTSTDWAVSTNWGNNTVPGINDDAIINVSANMPTIGTTQAIRNLTINNGGILNIGVLGSLNVASNLIVSPGAAITGNYANISGNVTLQQSITGQRGFRIFANPFTSALNINTVASSNGITIGTIPYASGLTDGRIYDNSNNTWSNVTGSTFDANIPYALFIRGLASEVNGLDYTLGSGNGPSPFTYSVSGTLNGNSVNETPVAANPNFLLAGNPYAGPVNTQALTGGASLPYYTYQISTGSDQTARRIKAGSWVAQVGSDNNSTIPVLGVLAYQPQSTSNYPISASDINTAGTAAINLFGSQTKYALMELQVEKAGVYQDRLFVRLDPGARATGTDSKDLYKFYNDNVNVYTKSPDGKNLAVDARNELKEVIPLGIKAVSTGEYAFRIINSSLPEGTVVYLKDSLLNTQSELKIGDSYSFTIGADSLTQGEKRFALLFSVNKAITITDTATVNAGNMSVELLGNIVNGDAINVRIAGSSGPVRIMIRDMNGRAVGTVTETNGIHQVTIGNNVLGMFIMEFSDGKTRIVKKVMKL